MTADGVVGVAAVGGRDGGSGVEDDGDEEGGQQRGDEGGVERRLRWVVVMWCRGYGGDDGDVDGGDDVGCGEGGSGCQRGGGEVQVDGGDDVDMRRRRRLCCQNIAGKLGDGADSEWGRREYMCVPH
ncbi:hypothetical protein Tco_0227007 [Tanacetum coccineum]